MIKTIEEQFEEVCDRIETEFRGDVQILVNKDYRGFWHIDVQEIGDSEEDDDWDDGWFTINSGVFENLKEAIIWLNQHY